LEIEQFIRKFACSTLPGIGVLGEEFGEDEGTTGTRLIIDPIDGTRNFVRGLPFFGTLLGVEVNGEITMGMVSAPYFGERWWGGCGETKGAWYRNTFSERALSVSNIEDLADSQIFHGSLYGCEAAQTPMTLQSLLSKTNRQRGVGDYYLHMLVASGAGEIGVDFGLKPWDKAPLKAIVEGAGGSVTNMDGSFTLEHHSIVSSNGRVHAAILDILNSRDSA
jgi:histidinol-phosphatase